MSPRLHKAIQNVLASWVTLETEAEDNDRSDEDKDNDEDAAYERHCDVMEELKDAYTNEPTVRERAPGP